MSGSEIFFLVLFCLFAMCVCVFRLLALSLLLVGVLCVAGGEVVNSFIWPQFNVVLLGLYDSSVFCVFLLL